MRQYWTLKDEHLISGLHAQGESNAVVVTDIGTIWIRRGPQILGADGVLYTQLPVDNAWLARYRIPVPDVTFLLTGIPF